MTYAEGMKLIVVPPNLLNDVFQFDHSFETSLLDYKKAFGEQLYIGVSRHYGGDDSKQLHRLAQYSQLFQIPIVATNDVHYHEPARRQLQDIVTCVREGCTIYNAGFALHPNAERYLKPPADEMLRLFRHYPDAIRQTGSIAEACTFSLDELKYEYPEEITTEGRTTTRRTYAPGLARRNRTFRGSNTGENRYRN
jgi:error-prone DNA polymerase